MSIIRTDEKYYGDIVDSLNLALDNSIKNLPSEIAPRINSIEKTCNKLYGRKAPLFTSDFSEIILTPENPSKELSIDTDSDGEIEIINSIPNSIQIEQASNKIIKIIKKQKNGQGTIQIKIHKTNNFKEYISPLISIKVSNFAKAKGSPLEKQKMDALLKHFQGKLIISNQPAPLEQVTPLNSDNTVFCQIQNMTATIYSKEGSGVFAPPDSSNLFNSYEASDFDLQYLDTSQVTTMEGMFVGCNTHKRNCLNLSSFNTSKVTNMADMFAGCFIPTINLINFDTSQVTDMSGMFNPVLVILFANSSPKQTSSTYYIEEILGLEDFNTSNVTQMNYMFSDARGLKTIDVKNFNTSKVNSMRGMFAGTTFNYLDLSNFNIDSVTNVAYMFFGAKIGTIVLPSFNKIFSLEHTEKQEIFEDASNSVVICNNIEEAKELAELSITPDHPLKVDFIIKQA